MSQAVVLPTRKLRGSNVASKASTRYDRIRNSAEPERVYETTAPSVRGRAGLTFAAQRAAQEDLYSRTLGVSSLFVENLAQEVRQTKLRDETLHLCVNVAREDFPATSADIKIAYRQSAAQAAWRVFLVDVRVALKIEFIESILDRMDLAPVNRVVSLRDGGQYYVKQREASAILEVIESGKLPQQVSWAITEGINIAKDNLLESGRNQTVMDRRIDTIINLPMIRENQRESCFAVLDAENAQEVLDAVDAMMHSIDLPPDEMKIALARKARVEEEARLSEEARVEVMNNALAKGATAAELLALNSAEAYKPEVVELKTYDKEVDIVLVHRLALESLSRLAARKPEALSETAHASYDFIQQTLVRFRDEIDIVLMAVKLIGELCEYLLLQRRDMYIVIFDTVQCYAPPPLFYIPRVVHRLLSPEELAEEERIFNSQFVMEDDDDDELGKYGAPEDDEAKMRRQLEALGVRIVGEEPEAVDDDSTVDEAKVEEEEEEDCVEQEEEVEDVLVRRPGEKKAWKGSVGYVGKLYRKKLSEREDASFDELFGGDGDDDDGTPNVPGLTRKKKSAFRPAKFTLRPLPWTKGITHRGFVGNEKYRNGLILLQCFATVYKLLTISFGYREQAFDLFLHEEVADIAVVSVGLPRLLEYVIWIIDVMYLDGFMNEEEDEATIDPSMQVTVPRVEAVVMANNNCDDGILSAGEGDDVSIDPVTGMVIDAVSTVTQPSVDLDGLNRELAAPEVNLGDPDEVYEPWTAGPVTREEEPNNITISVCLDPEAKEREEIAKKIAQGIPGFTNTKLQRAMGERAFNRRYRGRPKDIVIIALALISRHCDLAQRDRELADKWLAIFDDCSASFRFLVRRGEGLNGL